MIKKPIIFLSVVFMFITGAVKSQNVSLLLTRPVSGSGNPGMVDSHLLEDHQGGFYFLGLKNLKMSYNNFIGDIYVVRMNAQQQLLFPEQIWKGRARINDAFAFPNGDLLVSGFAYDTLILPGNDTLLFNFPAQEFVVRMDKNGQIIYRQKHEFIEAVTGYSDNNILVIKQLFTQIGHRFVRYSPAGQALDSVYATGSGFINDMDISETGDLFVSGGCLDPTLTVNGNSISGGPSYNGYMYGIPAGGSGLYTQFFVDMTCPEVRVEAIPGGGAITGGTTMAAGPLGPLQVQGPSAFGMDMVMFKTDNTGTPLWVFETPNSGGQNDFAPATGRFFGDSPDYTAVWGNFRGQGVTWPGGLQNTNTAYPYSQPLLMGVNAGNVIWLKQFTGGSSVYPHDLVNSEDGCVYFSALVMGPVTFDSVVISGGQYDLQWVVLRYCPVTVVVNEIDTESDIRVYPNPVSDQLNISTGGNLTTLSPGNLQLTDLHGRSINVPKHLNTQGATLDLSGLHSGYYILKITTKQEIKCFPVVRN